jgi:hypothetical protein
MFNVDNFLLYLSNAELFNFRVRYIFLKGNEVMTTHVGGWNSSINRHIAVVTPGLSKDILIITIIIDFPHTF